MSEIINEGHPTSLMLEVMKHTKKTTRTLLKNKYGLGSRASIGRIDYAMKADRDAFDPDAADDDYKHQMTVFPYASRSITALSEENPDVYNEDLLEQLAEMYNTDPAIPESVYAFPSPYNAEKGTLNLILVFADVPLREARAADSEYSTIEDFVEPIEDTPPAAILPPRPVSKVNPLTLLRSSE